MKNLFNNISQEERKRILEMHENATKKHYLSEQNPEASQPTVSTPQPTGVPANAPDRTPGQQQKPYANIDRQSFNTKFNTCWSQSDVGQKFLTGQANAIDSKDRQKIYGYSKSKGMLNALFANLNGIYLGGLTKAIDVTEFNRLFGAIQNRSVNYQAPKSADDSTLTNFTSTIAKIMEDSYLDANNFPKQYVSLFQCALKA
jgi:hypothetical protein